MRAGVTVVDPATTWVDVDVDPRAGRRAAQDTQLHGRTHVAAGRSGRAGQHAARHDRRRGRRGPPRLVRAAPRSARARPSAPSPTCAPAPGSARGPKVGAFVETKNARVGAGSKVPAPVLRRRRRDRRGHQHRRGDGLRQLRRRREAPHRGRATTSGSARDTMLVAPVTDRGRRVHRGRLGHHRGRPARGAWRSAGPGSGPSRAGWPASGPGRRPPGRPRRRPAPRRTARDRAHGTSGAGGGNEEQRS